MKSLFFAGVYCAPPSICSQSVKSSYAPACSTLLKGMPVDQWNIKYDMTIYARFVIVQLVWLSMPGIMSMRNFPIIMRSGCISHAPLRFTHSAFRSGNAPRSFSSSILLLSTASTLTRLPRRALLPTTGANNWGEAILRTDERAALGCEIGMDGRSE